MTTVTKAAEYLSRLIEQGFGHYSLKLGTRGLESLSSTPHPPIDFGQTTCL